MEVEFDEEVGGFIKELSEIVKVEKFVVFEKKDDDEFFLLLLWFMDNMDIIEYV